MPPRQIARAPRHRAGKPVGVHSDSDSNSDSETGNETDSDEQSQHNSQSTSKQAHSSFPTSTSVSSKPALQPSASSFPFKSPQSRRQIKQNESESDDESGSEESDSESRSGSDSDSDSDSASDSSDDERPQLIRPVFMSKAKRARIAAQASQSGTKEQTEAELAARKQSEADALLQAHLEKEALAAEARKKAWDDDEGQAQAEADIDDTDDVEPETEYIEWKLRELLRLKRDRELLIAGEKEREEIERRRNLTAEERAREDAEFFGKQEQERQERREQGQAGSMQRYFHKGAFFAEENAEKRNFMNARLEDGLGDRDVLPEYLKVRDATMVGRRSRTRYRDMKTEDTGEWGRYEGKSFSEEKRNGAGTGANDVEIGGRKRARFQ